MDGNSRHYGKILQVLPAQSGWGAVYGFDDDEYVTGPLACWALVEDKATGQTSVVGMVAETTEIDFAPTENFLGYTYPGCKIDWSLLAKTHQRKEH